MNYANATLESLRAVAGIQGDGTSVLGAEVMLMPLPIELIEPKAYRVDSDRQRGIRNDLMIRVDRLALELREHTPVVGDRLSIKRDRLNAPVEPYEVSDIKELNAGAIVELVLMVRDDTTAEGGA